jgi:hypothetical protein
LSAEIDPRINRIHSLAESLRAFKKFHDDNKDIFAMKDAIMRSQHALETLFKNMLYQLDPALLLPDETKIKKLVDDYQSLRTGNSSNLLDSTTTINLEDTVKRLQKLRLLKGIENSEYEQYSDSLKSLNEYRDKLQHFRVKAEPAVIGRILGNVLPKSVDIIEATHRYLQLDDPEHFSLPPIMADLEKFYDQSRTVLALLRKEYDELMRQAILFLSTTVFQDQPLIVRIKYRGKEDASDQISGVSLNGFLEYEIDWFSVRMPSDETIVEGYKEQMTIAEPQFTADVGSVEHGMLEGSMRIIIKTIVNPRTILKLPDFDKVAGLGRLGIAIEISLHYKSKGTKTGNMLRTSALEKLSGKLKVNTDVISRGSKSIDTELVGVYEAALDTGNTSLEIFAFLFQNGSFDEANFHFDLRTAAKGNLTFTKQK